MNVSTEIFISVLALVVSVLGVIANMLLTSRQIKIMEKELRQQIFANIQISLESNRFIPRLQKFLIRVTKVGQGDISDLKLRLRHPTTKAETMINHPKPLIFEQTNSLSVDIFPELDVLLQGIGLYDHARLRLLTDAPVFIDFMASWQTLNFGDDCKTLSLTIQPDISKSNELALNIFPSNHK
jgi:hypothetical protein